MKITPARFARNVLLALAWGIILSYVLHQVMLPELGHHISTRYTFSWAVIYAGILLAISYHSAKREARAQRKMAYKSQIQEIEIGERLVRLHQACSYISVADLASFKDSLHQLRAK